VVDEINDRPRSILAYHTAREVFLRLSHQQPGVAFDS
jgi:IS30 family transposase